MIKPPSPNRAFFREVLSSPLQSLLDQAPLLEVGLVPDRERAEPESQAVVVACEVLQDIADYRSALQDWFRACAINGRLIITVPHAFLHDRQAELSKRRRPEQKRLYTAASLMAEVEEALVPNTYRVRYLADADQGYDYGLEPEQAPTGAHHVVLVLEKIVAPAWSVTKVPTEALEAPVPLFEAPRTRIELTALAPRQRILALKLDHLGDFIMGLPGLERLRKAFPSAHITLVVGSWNAELAENAGVADEVLVFDAYPRNSNEAPVDVQGKTANFEALVVEPYDLAIDLRTDPDTRFLLQSVRAGIRAGMGTRVRFPYLDIFLPIDFTREEFEQARRDVIDHHAFASKLELARSPFRIFSNGREIPRDNALVWGPYWKLRPGHYVFEPSIEIAEGGGGALLLDIGLNAHRVCGLVAPTDEPLRLPFTVVEDEANFEFRIWSVDGAPLADFSFYGGRLIRQGASSVLHQSEYIQLLVELVRLRISETGILFEAERG